MNVIIVNDYSYINGGAGEIAVSTALALAERGHEVIFSQQLMGIAAISGIIRKLPLYVQINMIF